MKKTKLLILVAVLGLVFYSTALADEVNTGATVKPTTVYVDDDYTSESSGEHTWGYDAFATIQDGVDAVDTAGTVNVAAGTYAENIVIDKKIELLSVSGAESTFIEGQTGVDSVIKVFGVEASSGSPVQIIGFTIDANEYPTNELYNEGGIFIYQSDYVQIEDSEIVGFKGDGILIYDGNNNTISGNTITGSENGSVSGINIYGDSSDNVIGGNSSSDGNAISLATSGSGNLYDIYISGANTNDNWIEYNTISGGERGIQQDGGCTGETTIYHNSISNTSVYGVEFEAGWADVQNNTFTDTTAAIKFSGGQIIFSSNIIDGTTSYGVDLTSFSATSYVNYNTIHDVAGSNAIIVQSNSGGLSIDNNEIYSITGGSSSNAVGRAIEIYGAADGVSITENEIYYATGYAAIVVDTGAEGVNIEHNIIHDNTIGGVAVNAYTSVFDYNDIYDNGYGVEVGDNNNSSTTFLLHYNNIYGNCAENICSGVVSAGGVSAYTGSVNATSNWWGAVSGPYNATNNSSGTGNSVTDNVYFDPWLTSAYVEKSITAFTISNQVGDTTIDQENHIISLTMPYGTDVTDLVATFTTTGSSVKVGETTQVSGTTSNDFTNSVTYRVYATDNTYQDYVVTVSVVTTTPPVASDATITDTVDGAIILDEGTTTNVVITGTVTDAAGCEDITSVAVKLYRTGVTASADDNDNNHYTSTAIVDLGSCTGIGDLSATYTATIPVQYYADPTDTDSAYASDNWTTVMTPSDSNGAGTSDTDTAELATLVAMSVTDSVSYGSLSMGTNTGTTDQATTVTNTGNTRISTAVDGYGSTDGDGKAMVCTTGSVPIEDERYYTTAETAYSSKTSLSDTSTQVSGLYVDKTTSSTPSTASVYWGLGMPSSGVYGSCSGKIIFTPSMAGEG